MPRAASAIAIAFGVALGLGFSNQGGRIKFEALKDAGVPFVLRNAASAEKHLIETMVGGVAVFDFDNDGRLDIFFANGARQPDLQKAGKEYWNRLYRNLGQGKFEDVTERAGLQGEGFSIGAAAADFDNDGFQDLFVASVNRNLLYRNRGDGTFEDVTSKAGIAESGPQPWAVAAGWFDYDRDGDLDLFIVNYVKWDPAKEPFCGDPRGTYRTYCHPRFYEGLPNALYRNNGDGTFSNVSGPSGIGFHIGKGMGVAFADYDEDGDLDVFVTNDTVPNFLFRNEGGRAFREVALEAGVGYNDDGRAISSMGVDFRDIDNDGREDLFITALSNETFPLFRNLGKGLFADVTYPSRLGTLTLPLSGWGTGIYDFDNDGWKDIFAANGDVQDNTELFSSRKSRLASTIFLNLANGKFEMIELGKAGLHRGAAFGDLDGDGRVDVVVSRIQDEAAILLNRSGEGNHWVAFRLRGTRSNRDGIGAKVKVASPSGTQWNTCTTSVGYGSSSDRTVHFGLGKDDIVKEVEIRWPSGVVQRLTNVSVDRYLNVTEPEQ
jgi:ASPIC and UnbV./FG-GAP repeat.